MIYPQSVINNILDNIKSLQADVTKKFQEIETIEVEISRLNRKVAELNALQKKEKQQLIFSAANAHADINPNIKKMLDEVCEIQKMIEEKKETDKEEGNTLLPVNELMKEFVKIAEKSILVTRLDKLATRLENELKGKK